jgi:hypothetical protein
VTSICAVHNECQGRFCALQHFFTADRREGCRLHPSIASRPESVRSNTLPSTPSRCGVDAKRTRRQTQAGVAPNTQADVAPNPNPWQLSSIAAHCRFEPSQGLAVSQARKRHRGIDHSFLARALPVLRKTDTAADLSSPIFSLPVRFVARLPWRAFCFPTGASI